MNLPQRETGRSDDEEKEKRWEESSSFVLTENHFIGQEIFHPVSLNVTFYNVTMYSWLAAAVASDANVKCVTEAAAPPCGIASDCPNSGETRRMCSVSTMDSRTEEDQRQEKNRES